MSDSSPPTVMPGQPPFIQLNAVTKRWPNGSVVLEGLDLAVNKGDFISLIGPSGCGKSTLLRLLSGLSPVTSGGIILDGMEPENAREIMSFIFQDATLLHPLPLNGGGTREVAVQRTGLRTFRLDPWPFSAGPLSFEIPGRPVPGDQFSTPMELQTLYATAPVETLTVHLHP